MDTKTLRQRFMGSGNTQKANGHSDDVLCLDVNVTRKLAVTGSVGSEPTIILWDTESLAIIAKTKLPRGSRAVSSVRFS
jgi:WD40 repeat protein